MKHLLKYLLFSFIALALYSSAGDDSYANVENYLEDNPAGEYILSTCDFTTPQGDFSQPRPISTVNAPRVQSNGRNNETSHRQNVEFVKSGRIINTGVRFVAQIQSLSLYSFLTDSGRKRVSFCRFII